jgi:hypothetical protein
MHHHRRFVTVRYKFFVNLLMHASTYFYVFFFYYDIYMLVFGDIRGCRRPMKDDSYCTNMQKNLSALNIILVGIEKTDFRLLHTSGWS